MRRRTILRLRVWWKHRVLMPSQVVDFRNGARARVTYRGWPRRICAIEVRRPLPGNPNGEGHLPYFYTVFKDTEWSD